MYPNTIQTAIPDYLDQTLNAFYRIPEIEWAAKPHIDKWSKKEVLGHLIDSAMNNIRRLIVTQYKINDKIRYEQNEWVRINEYQSMKTENIILLWKLLNLQFERISKTLPVTSLDLTTDTGKDEPSLHTLAFIIEDYWGHQQHHLRQILEGSIQ